MSDLPAGPLDSPALQAALAWLNTPGEDALQDLVPLRRHLAAVAEAGIAPLQLLKILDLFQTRTDAIHRVLEPMLLDATLPVSRRLRTIAHGLIETHSALATGYLRVLREADPIKLAQPKRSATALCAQGMNNLVQQYRAALLTAAPAPADTWGQAQVLFQLSRRMISPDETLPHNTLAVERPLKQLLALAAAQPEGFAPMEVHVLAHYLSDCSGQVDLSERLPEPAAEWYWLEEKRDLPPVAVARRAPAPGASLLYFSCSTLGRNTEELLASLDDAELAGHFQLPHPMSPMQCRNALHRAASRWIAPPVRHSHRRRQSYRVQVCTSFETLWTTLHGESTRGGSEPALTPTHWMVINESPGGFAIMHVAGSMSGLVAGSALGLRNGDEQPWSICLVRWARSDNPEHLELGLELVAPAAQAVRIVGHPASVGAAPALALRLPPLPALQRGECLLVGRGDYQPGPLTLLSEDGGRVQVTECTVGNLISQTAVVELFEFNRDFLPA